MVKWHILRRFISRLFAVSAAGILGASALAAEPQYRAELVFPLDDEHNHAPGIVECPGGDLLVSWYRGSGERSADDVAVYGARLRRPAVDRSGEVGRPAPSGTGGRPAPSGETEWSEPFVMADEPGFPDCNTCMMVDGEGRLWLFWPTILANTWESCITNYKVATEYTDDGSPKWDKRGLVLLKPDGLEEKALPVLEEYLARLPEAAKQQRRDEIDEVRQRLGEKLFQRLGWQPRCKPTVLPSGRILLPLYTDTFSISIMAVSDDGGQTWYASEPLVGFGNIQPSVLRRDDGTLVAYMRENGPRNRIRVSESNDEGITWGPVGVADLPNPGSGLDGVRLPNGHWLLVYNDTTSGRNSLAVSISDDEGRTWKWTRHLERHEGGEYHYPAVIQGADGTIHAVYSYFVEGGKSMKHAAFNEEWVQAGD